MTQARIFAIHPYPPRKPRVTTALNLAALTALEKALEDLRTPGGPPLRRPA